MGGKIDAAQISSAAGAKCNRKAITQSARHWPAVHPRAAIKVARRMEPSRRRSLLVRDLVRSCKQPREALPTGHTRTLGAPIAWNTAFQLRVKRILWPEIEVNSTFFRGGPHDGMAQTFVSPGFEVSKIKLTSDATAGAVVSVW